MAALGAAKNRGTTSWSKGKIVTSDLLSPNDNESHAHPRHGGRFNMLFADGHVEPLTNWLHRTDSGWQQYWGTHWL